MVEFNRIGRGIPCKSNRMLPQATRQGSAGSIPAFVRFSLKRQRGGRLIQVRRRELDWVEDLRGASP